MNRKLLHIFLIFISSFGLSAQIKNAQDLTIEVRSTDLNKPIKNAIVDVKGYGEKHTGSDGKAIFIDIPEGNYRFSIDAQGFMYHFPNNTVKVTEGNNYNYAELKPAPSNLFFINGKVVNQKNEPIENVNVLFRSITGDLISIKTITDEWGYYDFSFMENQVQMNTMFSVDFKKDGFLLVTENDRVFNKNQIRLPTIEMKKNNYKTN